MREAELERLHAKLTAVRELAQERLRKADLTPFGEALDRFYSRTSPEEVIEREPEEVYGATLALWRFSARRKPGEAKVRLYNPRMSEHGWESVHSVLEIVNDDMPFLVDSLTSLLTERGAGIHALMHPIVSVTRDREGNRTGFAEPGTKGALHESVIQVQVDQIGDQDRLARLEGEVREVLQHVRAATQDWRAMLERLGKVTEGLRSEVPKGAEEATTHAVEFLEWLAADHFTFLGCREYRLLGEKKGSDTVEGSGLGLMRDPDFTVMRNAEGQPADWSPEMYAFLTAGSPLLIIKANRRSSVHRRVHLDAVGVKRYDKKGKVIGEHVFVGLFTSAAYNRSPREIPLLHQKVERIIARAGFAPGSHDAKALTNVLETYPRDELFQSSDDQLYHNALGVLHLAARPRTRLFVRPDRFGRFMSCMIYVPRERYNTELRVRLGELLSEAFNGRVAAWSPSFGDDTPLARVHFVIAAKPGGIAEYDLAEIEERIVGVVRSWTDLLREALVDRKGEDTGNRLYARYGGGFPVGYRDMFHAGGAIDDIEKMQTLTGDTPLAINFYRRLEDPESAVRFKLYHLGTSLPLSDCLPVLEHMGFRVLEEHPFEVLRSGDEAGDEAVWLHDFFMETVSGGEVDLAALRDKLEDAFAAVWAGAADDDRLNRLVVLAGLRVRQTVLLRAIGRFLRQARIPYSIEYMEDALAANPAIARDLVKLFSARFDPARGEADGRKAEAERIRKRIETALDQVSSLDVDRILRRFRNVIDAMVRTNYYQRGPDGRPKPYVSFKFDSGALDELPLPRPWREIFVYCTWVEGVHLRGGPVARGGLRWSDRKEDYRTEVLGLVKAQMVKNAVIVPVGSKGGFLPKRLPAGGSRDEVQAEAIRCYRTYLSGLLDITDNLVDGKVVHPAEVIRYDDDDPYLVVAADKGTATFSDIANEMALSYGFWLGDAFASGGSHGYDHKGMAITAKGAWEAVKRHFRELGSDIQSEPFSAIGVGDMSGDVFGNGMLLSKQTRLLAAFDHRDIFIDPEPDPAKSFEERKRLFGLSRSSWQDYNAKLISKGGGVFSRAAKSIALTPQIKQLTGLKADKVTPFELMRALLKVPADLMWFGGIGTYVKADHETDLDVGDRGNDAIRVDATQLRVKVIGEGANLGVTQRGRIQAALRGIKLNTDAVDNSGGVDCSDHEVNIKIALGSVVAAGDMTEKQRNTLLARMTDEVGGLVLKTNYHQTLAISMVEARAPQLLDEHSRFMHWLETRGVLSREVELLPNDEELAERARDGRGLTRPEISVLVAYAKIDVFSDLVASDVPDNPWMERLLFDYMPEPVHTKYRKAVSNHRLRREIIATVAANALVNEVGPSLYFRLREETGAAASESVRAYIIAREVFGLRAIAGEINALDNKAPAATQLDMHLALGDLMAAQCLRLVQGGRRDIGQAIEFFRPGVEQIARTAQDTITAYSKKRLGQRTAELEKAKAPKKLAAEVAALELLGGAVDVVEAASRLERGVADVAANYFAAGARFELDWLRSLARQVRPSDHWERIALGRLMSDLRAQQSAIGAAALGLSKAKPGAASLQKWAEENAEVADRADRLLAELKSGGALSVAKLAVAASLFRAIRSA